MRGAGARDVVAMRTVRLGLLVLPLAAAACATAPARYLPSAALAARYVPRESWGAAEPTPDWAPMTAVGRLTVHHTGFPEEGGAPAGQVAREVQRFHQEERGWADIGYHFVVGADGRVAEGRVIGMMGAHVGGHNDGNVGVVVGGDFRTTEVPALARQGLELLLVELLGRYHLPRSAVATHREFGPTECPGDRLQAVIDAFRGTRPERPGP